MSVFWGPRVAPEEVARECVTQTRERGAAGDDEPSDPPETQLNVMTGEAFEATDAEPGSFTGGVYKLRGYCVSHKMLVEQLSQVDDRGRFKNSVDGVLGALEPLTRDQRTSVFESYPPNPRADPAWRRPLQRYSSDDSMESVLHLLAASKWQFKCIPALIGAPGGELTLDVVKSHIKPEHAIDVESPRAFGRFMEDLLDEAVLVASYGPVYGTTLASAVGEDFASFVDVARPFTWAAPERDPGRDAPPLTPGHFWKHVHFATLFCIHGEGTTKRRMLAQQFPNGYGAGAFTARTAVDVYIHLAMAGAVQGGWSNDDDDPEYFNFHEWATLCMYPEGVGGDALWVRACRSIGLKEDVHTLEQQFASGVARLRMIHPTGTIVVRLLRSSLETESLVQMLVGIFSGVECATRPDLDDFARSMVENRGSSDPLAVFGAIFYFFKVNPPPVGV